jgi:hypothetical protein
MSLGQAGAVRQHNDKAVLFPELRKRSGCFDAVELVE